jgi:hypothetical protein
MSAVTKVGVRMMTLRQKIIAGLQYSANNQLRGAKANPGVDRDKPRFRGSRGGCRRNRRGVKKFTGISERILEGILDIRDVVGSI